jgi:hypothetical protein
MKLNGLWTALPLLGATTALGCGQGTMTGVHLTVRLSGLSIDAIRFTVTPDGRQPVVAQRPEGAASTAALTDPQDLLVYLDDDLAGRAATCEAIGMTHGLPTSASGATTATLTLSVLVPATLTLRAPTVTIPLPRVGRDH